ncbi:MAG: phage/plasmid primase, P4 family [Burkholderiales bacterium]
MKELGERGFELWASWSATSKRFPGGDGLEKWNSFKGERTGHQAIFAKAQDRGWKNPRALDIAAVGFGQAGQSLEIMRPLMPFGDVRDGTTTTEPLTQHGNALRLKKLTLGELLHVWEKRLWLKWITQAWRRSDAAEVRDLALSLLPKMIYQEGTQALAHDFRRFADHARKSSEAHYAAQTVDILGGMPDVRIAASDLDADPWMISFDKGRQVIDLRTAEHRAAQPGDFVTRSLNVDSLGEVAKAVRWHRFVQEIFSHDPELISWIHRFCGYALTALTVEQFFLFLFGHGANGKSVFTEVLRDLFGDYSLAVAPATLCDDKRTGAGASPDLARLDGMRLAIAPEAETSSTLAESLVKGLIAGDVMSVRVPYGMPFEMKPVLKLMMTGNHKPRILSTDRGIWRRVRLVPFLANFEGRADKSLTDTLKAENPSSTPTAVSA